MRSINPIRIALLASALLLLAGCGGGAVAAVPGEPTPTPVLAIDNKQIIAAAAGFDVSAIAAAGDLSIFEKYEDYDLHVGHRLHGHIGFLRRRIPSVLIMEDARSRGFGSSIPVGCFPGFRPASSVDEVEADPNTVARVAEFLRQETRDGFMRYVGVAPYLDRMLDDLVLPQLRLKYELATRALARATS